MVRLRYKIRKISSSYKRGSDISRRLHSYTFSLILLDLITAELSDVIRASFIRAWQIFGSYNVNLLYSSRLVSPQELSHFLLYLYKYKSFVGAKAFLSARESLAVDRKR